MIAKQHAILASSGIVKFDTTAVTPPSQLNSWTASQPSRLPPLKSAGESPQPPNRRTEPKRAGKPLRSYLSTQARSFLYEST